MSVLIRFGAIYKAHNFVFWGIFFLFTLGLSFESLGQFTTILEGKISPASPYQFVVEYQYQYLTYQPKRQLLTTNEKGEFSFSIPLEKSTWVIWKCQDKQGQVYLHVGDSLNMQLNFGTSGYEAKFSGLGATENNFLWKWENEFGDASKNALYPKKYKNSKEKNFKNEVEKLQKSQYKLLEETIGKQPLSDDFILALEHRIAYENANHLAEYPILHAHLNNKTPENLSSSYYSFFEDVIIQSPSALSQPSYLRFLRNYLEFRYVKYHNENYLKAYSDLYYPILFEITEKELQGSVQAHAQALLVIELIEQGNEKLYKKYYKKYSSTHKKDNSALIVEEFLKNSQKLKIGKLAPNFLLQDVTGKNVRLSDYKGKVVYLFFSSPKNEFRETYLEGFEYLNNQFTQTQSVSKQVVFLWIETEKLTLLSDKTVEDKFKAFNIIRLPCYFSDTLEYNLNKLPVAFLIDKKGKLAYSVTKLPSEAGLLEDINYLLRE